MSNATYEAALAAVQTMFGDTSVSRATTLENLRALQDEMDVMIQSLEADADRETAAQEDDDL